MYSIQQVFVLYRRYRQDERPPWSWSYGSWIYNYLCNHCLSLLTLQVQTPFMSRCTQYNIMW